MDAVGLQVYSFIKYIIFIGLITIAVALTVRYNIIKKEKSKLKREGLKWKK